MRQILFCIGLFGLVRAGSQVHLQTGAAQFSLPIYQYSDDNNRIGFGVTLTYVNGNGLKVNEMASPFGSGWLLECGGEITRQQNGEPDDQHQTQPWDDWTTPAYKNRYFPNGYLYAEADFVPAIQVNNGGAFYPLYTEKKDYRPPKRFLADREQDVFNFSFNGRSGAFVIGKDWSIKSIHDSKLKIEKLQEPMGSTVRTTISGFVITDETGIKYIFKDRDLAEVIKYDRIQQMNSSVIRDALDFDQLNECTNWFNCRNILLGRGLEEYVVNKWHLTEIVNPFTKTKISYAYEEYPVDINTSVSFQKSVNEDDLPKYSMSISRVKGKCKRISSINCSAEEKIAFTYSNIARQDLPYEKSIEEIKIYYGNECKRKWKFKMGYFGRHSILPLSHVTLPYFMEGSEENPYLRLCLLSVQKGGADNTFENPYEFTYNLGNPNNGSDGLPARFSYLHDHWGYSNAAMPVWSTALEYGNYIPMALYNAGDYAAQLTDPLFRRQVVDKLAQNGILKTVRYPSGGELSFAYEQNTVFHNGVNQPVGGVRVSKTTVHDGVSHLTDIVTEYRYADGSNRSHGWGYEPPVYEKGETVMIHKQGSRVGSVNMSQVASSLPRTMNVWPSSQVRITVGDALTNSLENVLKGMAQSYLVNALFSLIGGSSGRASYYIHTYSSEPLNYQNGLPMQYSKVEVVTASQMNNGKTVYEFTSPSMTEIPLRYPILGFPYSAKPRYAPWLYGLVKNMYVFDKNGAPVKWTENKYKFYSEEYKDEYYKSQKWAANTLIYDTPGESSGILNSSYSNYITSDFYYPLTGRTELVQTNEYLYKNSVPFKTASEKYFYNSDYQLSKTETYNSKDELIENYVYYPNDYTSAGIFKDLQEANIINIQLASQTFITKNGNKFLLSGSVNEFGVAEDHDFKIIKTFRFESDGPVASAHVAFNPDNWLPNPAYYKLQRSISYNTAGSPKLVESEGRKLSSLYDYNNKLPVANILNASADRVFYTSFEAENKGGWEYQRNNVVGEYSPTGNKCFRFPVTGASISTAGFASHNQAYVLSFWTKGGQPAILSGSAANGFSHTGTLIKSYTNSATGWTYYEYQTSAMADIVIDNTDGGRLGPPYTEFLIDEIRLYPANARFRSVTYNPLVGKTSESDENGRITYYEYDGLGRLKLMRDENRNVLKAYEYNTKKVFYNSQASLAFQKQGCPTGYEGTATYYTVPAGKYSSLVSQADAEQKAAADIQANGQNEANAQGSCVLTQPVYAEIAYENVQSYGAQTFGDVVIRFYDANGAPFTVHNYSLTYYATNNCGYGTMPTSIVVTGQQVTLATNSLLYYTDWVWSNDNLTWEFIDCLVSYNLY